MNAAERKIADCPGGRLSYREAGPANAPVMLLMHGVGGNARSFRGQLEALSNRFRVIAWDAPGYGDSTLRDASLESYSRAALELLDALKVQSSHMLGHSMGGVVAQGVAGLAPARVEHLVLSSTFTGYHHQEGTPLTESWRARLRDIQNLSPAEFGQARARSMLAEGASDAARQEAADIASEVRHDGLKAASEMLHVADTRETARALTAPTLVITGEMDQVVPPARSAEMADLIPGARRLELRGVGHAAYLEDPATYNASLNDFFG